MSKSYEFQAKNVEKALELASDELNIPAEKLKHEVVTYGSTGIFGLVGIKKAKIKVFVEEKKTDKNKNNPSEELPLPENSDNLAEDSANDKSYDGKSDEEIIPFGIKALQTIVDGISAGATIKSEQNKEKLLFSISGGDSGVLIGKRGQTLEAIQYLLEKMINKKTTKKIRVMVDVEGYLEKRKANLKQMASRMAEKAKKMRKPVTIGQMNAHDRRIVHIHLKDENGIRTQSVGDGYYRKLMIFPKKQGSPKGRDNNPKV
jgi:spoIIIJ-associated protein